MGHEDKTKEQLIAEITELQQKLAELERAQQEQNPRIMRPALQSTGYRYPIDRNDSLSQDQKPQNPINKAHKYHISDLIDIALIQQLFDSFYQLTGIGHALLDSDGNILSRNGWSDMCLKFHRTCRETEKQCKQSDKYISAHLQDSYIRYKCLNGLIDYATPIILEGRHIATIYMGQLLEEPPDEGFFRRQARQFGFDEDAYIDALHKITIVPEQQVKLVMDFYSKLGQVLSAIGLEKMRQLEASDLALSASEERLRMVLEASNDGYWDWDLQSDRVYFSRRWADVLGYSLEELEPTISTWKNLIHPCDFPEAKNSLFAHLRGKTPKFESELRLLTKSGEWKWILERGKVVVRDEQGKALRFAGISIDITARKQAENTLRISEEKFSKVFHESPIMMTLSSIHEGIFIDANEAIFAGMGYNRYEIIGRPISEINLFADTAQKQKLDSLIKKKRKLESFEVDFRTKSGNIRRGLLWSNLLYLNEKLCRITTLIDITEQKRIEQEMARLSNLNLIGEIAASIGHEIRNPMTSVRGFLQMFKEKYQEDSEFLDLMVEELDRANVIISEFLGMAKDKMVCLQAQYIDQVVKTIYPMLEAEANYKGQKINLELGRPPMPMIDQNEIRQVIFNLAHNGLEAMSPGGTLTIGTTVEESDIVLYVKDEGPGIKPEIMDKIGIPFFTTKENGTGLGLSICYSIAARHNARLEVRSNPAGTTFKLRFPQQGKAHY